MATSTTSSGSSPGPRRLRHRKDPPPAILTIFERLGNPGQHGHQLRPAQDPRQARGDCATAGTATSNPSPSSRRLGNQAGMTSATTSSGSSPRTAATTPPPRPATLIPSGRAAPAARPAWPPATTSSGSSRPGPRRLRHRQTLPVITITIDGGSAATRPAWPIEAATSRDPRFQDRADAATAETLLPAATLPSTGGFGSQAGMATSYHQLRSSLPGPLGDCAAAETRYQQSLTIDGRGSATRPAWPPATQQMGRLEVRFRGDAERAASLHIRALAIRMGLEFRRCAST